MNREEDAVEPQEPMDQIMDEVIEPAGDTHSSEDHQEDQNVDYEARAYETTMVPLSALQKKRERVKELELELQWERQKSAQAAPQKAPEDDNSRYESATKEDLSRNQDEIIRVIEERTWIKNNPEQFEYVRKNLPEFLKLKPNYAPAINGSLNRYEEAFELMDRFTPKQKQIAQKQLAPAQKKIAPNAPGGVPKAAALSESVDIMKMNDSEFRTWRQQQKGSRR